MPTSWTRNAARLLASASVAKREGEPVKKRLVSIDAKKADDEKRYVFGWASVTKDEDGNLVEDHQGTRIPDDVLEDAAYEYVLKFRGAKDMHVLDMGGNRVIESVVLTKEKQRAMGIPDDAGLPHTAWWIGLHIPNDEAWEKVKNGERRGFSIGGDALAEYDDD